LSIGAVTASLFLVLLAPAIGTSSPNTDPTAPADRYAMAGGCYGIRSIATGKYLVRKGAGFEAAASDVVGAEPFHFQATDLGSYLLFGTTKDFLAAADGAIGAALDSVTKTPAGGDLSGATSGTTDEIANTIKTGPLGEATGRGGGIVAAADASELADWEIQQLGADTFSVRLPALERFLSVGDDGTLSLSENSVPDASASFGFASTGGCAAWPEVDVNIDGPIATGANSFSEVRGFLDAHNHMMAFEFLGGRVRCGKPWDRYGVTHALVDCPDHEPGGHGAVLEAFLSGGNPAQGHATDGWPTFSYWPKRNSLTHEQIYYRWLERAWRGGLRMMTNLLADNHALCTIYPLKKNSCNEMDGVRLQAQRIRELERYIDAQNGGPGKGWFRIVTDPFQARRVINQGKLAVVLGIEVSSVLDCGIFLDMPNCTEQQVDQRLDEVYDLGVRQMELSNKFDNAIAGVTGDGGTTGPVVNFGNFFETGTWWRMEPCTAEDGESTDHTQMNLHDNAGVPQTGRDELAGAILAMAGMTGTAPVYGPGPHCNVRALAPLGEHMIRRMVEKGIMFDPDHMSARARRQAMDVIEQAKAPGVVSSHSWADITIYPRVLHQGGVVTPYAGGAKGFYEAWRAYRDWADPRFTFGFGYGSDVNGFGAQGGPRTDAPVKVSYPFTGFGGTTVYKQTSGERVFDYNVEGVAHYGLYVDWLEDLRLQGGDAIINDMLRGPEAYLQMWERTIGIAPDACRTDIPDLTDQAIGALQNGMSATQAVEAVGQPHTRQGTTFTYCMTGSRTATATFTSSGFLINLAIA
jgi:hypothetical protein